MRFSVSLTTGVQPEWPAFPGAFGISPVVFGWTPLTPDYLREYISTHAAAGPAKLSASLRHHPRFTRTLDGTHLVSRLLSSRTKNPLEARNRLNASRVNRILWR